MKFDIHPCNTSALTFPLGRFSLGNQVGHMLAFGLANVGRLEAFRCLPVIECGFHSLNNSPKEKPYRERENIIPPQGKEHHRLKSAGWDGISDRSRVDPVDLVSCLSISVYWRCQFGEQILYF